MKKAVILAVLVVVAFVAFSVLHNRVMSDPSKLENKIASTSSAKSSTIQPKKKAVDSPYVNGKANFLEKAFDFGYAPTNSTVYHPFYVTNVGSDTLDIEKVRPG
jgi:hypothetical protein